MWRKVSQLGGDRICLGNSTVFVQDIERLIELKNKQTKRSCSYDKTMGGTD